jgi:acyl-coenzyme A thioesterase PaaI-like protein
VPGASASPHQEGSPAGAPAGAPEPDPDSPEVPSSEESVSDFGIAPRHPPVTGPRTEVATAAAATAAPADATATATATADPRFALAAELRRITAFMVGRPIGDEAVAEVAQAAGALADRLEASAGPGRRPRVPPDPAGHPQDFFPTSPVIGFANPVAPPVVVEASEDGLRGTAFFDHQYEGPPTCVHGGVIALVFDELLGAANIAAGCPGMTGTLTVRYRRPTPLRTPLRLKARCLGRQGRKITTWGGIYKGDELLAEAEGIFIELVPERFLRVVAESGGLAGDPSG